MEIRWRGLCGEAPCGALQHMAGMFEVDEKDREDERERRGGTYIHVLKVLPHL